MTCNIASDVPRESYQTKSRLSLIRLAKEFLAKRKLSLRALSKSERRKIPNDRMVVLSPHLLRDIGLLDSSSPSRHK